MRSLKLCVEAAIAAEESNALKLSHAAAQLEGQPFGDLFRHLARDHRVQALKLRARLDAHLAMCGEPPASMPDRRDQASGTAF